MKQFTAAVVLAAAIAAFGTAAYAGEEEDILARIDESNLTESILKNHDNFSLHNIYYDE